MNFEKHGTCFEFVEVEKANVHTASGYTYFITFVVKDPCDDNRTIIFQAKVRNPVQKHVSYSNFAQKNMIFFLGSNFIVYI